MRDSSPEGHVPLDLTLQMCVEQKEELGEVETVYRCWGWLRVGFPGFPAAIGPLDGRPRRSQKQSSSSLSNHSLVEAAITAKPATQTLCVKHEYRLKQSLSGRRAYEATDWRAAGLSDVVVTPRSVNTEHLHIETQARGQIA